jgi:hypothetical protein
MNEESTYLILDTYRGVVDEIASGVLCFDIDNVWEVLDDHFGGLTEDVPDRFLSQVRERIAEYDAVPAVEIGRRKVLFKIINDMRDKLPCRSFSSRVNSEYRVTGYITSRIIHLEFCGVKKHLICEKTRLLLKTITALDVDCF